MELFAKIFLQEVIFSIFSPKAPPQMFDWVVNTPLLIKKSNRLHFKLVCFVMLQKQPSEEFCKMQFLEKPGCISVTESQFQQLLLLLLFLYYYYIIILLLLYYNFIKKETLAQVFSFEFCEIFKNIFFTEHLWVTTSDVKALALTL